MSCTPAEAGEMDRTCQAPPAPLWMALLWTGYFLLSVGYLLIRML